MINNHSDDWIIVEQHVQSRLNELRDELESLGCEDERAEQIRGAIDELKTLLKLTEPEVDASTEQDDGFIFQY